MTTILLLLLLILLTSQITKAFVPGQDASASSSSSSRSALAYGNIASLVIDIKERAPRDVQTMEQWANSRGAQRADGLELVPTNQDGSDVAFMTNQDLEENAPVLFIPADMILSSHAARQEFGYECERAEQLLQRIREGDQIPYFYLVVKILKEYELGQDSPWYYYLNSLPRKFTNGASMTHFCCTQTLPPFVGKLANAERVRFSKFFQALRQVSFLSDVTKRNRSIAKWAFLVAYTRSIEALDSQYDPSDVKIVPLGDYFNHGTDTEIYGTYDAQGNYCAYTAYNVPAGSPLRMSYGDPTNPSFLFARYGFLDETSPATFNKYMIDNPSQELINLGYSPSRMLFYKDTGQVSPETWDVLLFQFLGRMDQQAQYDFYNACMSGDEATKQSYLQQYYPEISDMLRQHIDGFLQILDEKGRKAHDRMTGKRASKHPRLPLILKHNEFVRDTFLRVRSQL